MHPRKERLGDRNPPRVLDSLNSSDQLTLLLRYAGYSSLSPPLSLTLPFQPPPLRTEDTNDAKTLLPIYHQLGFLFWAAANSSKPHLVQMAIIVDDNGWSINIISYCDQTHLCIQRDNCIIVF